MARGYLTVDSDRSKRLNELMRKMLRPQDILLLGFAHFFDVLEEARDPFGLVGKVYESYYGWLPQNYRRHNFSHLVWRNLKTGNIEKTVNENGVFLRLTSKGRAKITRDFPLTAIQQKKWDKKWRMVTFDIEELNRLVRESLRNRLKELGFGMLQKSVFISPYDITKDFAEFIEERGLNGSVFVLEVSSILIGDAREFANRIWKIEKLSEEYKKILRKIKDSHLTVDNDRSKKLKVGDGSRLELIRELREEYLRLLLRDPHLPKEFLPEDWVGETLKKEMKKMKVQNA